MNTTDKGLVIIYREGGAGANRGWATIFYAWLKGGALKNMQTFCQQKCYKLLLDAISKYSLLK